MQADDFRRMALALEGVIESAHMGHPDFRVGNRIFATLHTGDRFGMVTLTPEQQRECIDEHPEMFTPEAGAWAGRKHARAPLGGRGRGHRGRVDAGLAERRPEEQREAGEAQTFGKAGPTVEVS
jgi:YjbR protein